MRATRIQIKNFLSISEVEIRPGKVTQIVGGNAQGKTTVLRALETALKGSTFGNLVKHGEDAAEIIVEFDNDMKVRRRIRADGKNDVTVQKGDFKADSPQTFLNSLLSAGTFNPLELLEPKARTNALLKAVEIRLTPERIKEAVGDCPVPIPPLSYELHGLAVAEAAHKYFFARRAEANKDAATKSERHRVKAAELKPLPDVDPTVLDEDLRAAITISEKAIAAERGKAQLAQDRQNAVKKSAEGLAAQENEIAAKRGYIQRLEEALVKERQSLEAMIDFQAKLEADHRNVVVASQEVRVDDELIRRHYESINANQRELARRAEIRAAKAAHDAVDVLKKDAEASQAFAAKLDEVVKRLGPSFRADLVASADLPIPGLTFDDDQFCLDGCSLDLLSTAQSIRLGVAIARKLAGDLKVICVDGVEALDEKSWEALQKEISGDGFEYILAKVGEPFPGGPEDSVVRMEGGVAK
jgi:energy-coupling factor transporter ATP-binding protein EcfA2